MALTFIELLIVIAIIGVLVVLLLPAKSGGGRAPTTMCLHNVKSLGVAFEQFAAEHNSAFPMELSTNQGGTLEFNSGSETFRHFQAVSKYLSTPRLLLCPMDKRKMDTNFAGLSNDEVSYFVGLDASEVRRNMFLAGDRHLTLDGVDLKSGVYDLATNRHIGWKRSSHKRGGNIVLVGGSAEAMNRERLDEQNRLAEATNRVSIP